MTIRKTSTERHAIKCNSENFQRPVVRKKFSGTVLHSRVNFEWIQMWLGIFGLGSNFYWVGWRIFKILCVEQVTVVQSSSYFSNTHILVRLLWASSKEQNVVLNAIENKI